MSSSLFGVGGLKSALADVKSTSFSKSSPVLGTGGEGDSPPPSSPFSSSREMIPRIWSSALCGGRIGSGDFVCCLPRSVCSVSAHRSRSCGIEDGTLFIPDNGNNRFHKDYTLFSNDYPKVVVEELLRPRSGHEHRRLFDLVKRSNLSDLSRLDNDTLAEFFKTETTRWAPATPSVIQDTIKKPRKFLAKLEGIVEDDAEILGAISAFEEAVLQISDPVSPGSENTELFLADQVPKFRIAFDATGKLMKKLYGVITANKDAGEESMVEVFSRLESNLSEVYAVIGNFDNQERVLEGFGFDVASALGGVASGLKDLKANLGLEEDERPPPTKRGRWIEKVTEVEDRVKVVEDQVNGAVMEGFDFLIPEIKRMQEVIREYSASSSVGTQSNTEGKESVGDARLQGVVSEILYELGSLKRTVADLEVKKTPIPDASDYKLGGHAFDSLDAAKYFLSEAGDAGNDPSFYFDCFSVGALSSMKERSMEETLKMKNLTQNSGMPETLNAIAVLMSFSDTMPAIVGTTSEVVDKDFPLPKVKTFEEWYHPSTVTRTIMSRYDTTHDILEKHIAGFEDMVRIQPKLEPLVRVAKDMLSKSKKFIQELSRQVEGFRNQVLADDATPQEAWLLISQMLSTVFFEINKARTPFGDTLFDHSDKTHRCALVLIGTFRAHEKMEEIWKANFTKHPCVSTCLSLHLFAEKASRNKLSKIEEAQDDQKKKQELFQKSVQSQLDQMKRLIEARNVAGKKAAT